MSEQNEAPGGKGVRPTAGGTKKVAPAADEVPNVHVAIARVAADIGHVAKAQQMNAGATRYAFRGIDDVLNAIHTPLADHGVSIVPCGFDLHDSSERVTKSGGAQVHLLATVHYRIIGPAGDYVEAAALAEALDTSDKAASKAMSMAFKYVCFQVFSIPVSGALEESDREQLERGVSGPTITVEDLHNRLAGYAKTLDMSIEDLTEKYREKNGGISVEQFMALPAEAIFAYVRSVAQYVQQHEGAEK